MGACILTDGQDFSHSVHSYKSGNRCGHDPANPKLTLKKPASTNLPPSILAATDNADKYYYAPDDVFPSIAIARNAQIKSGRKHRSEGRECLILVIKILLKYTNLLTKRCEIPTENGLMALDIEWLANEAGIGLRRMERALKWLKSAGLIEVKERKAFRNGAYKSIAAVKCVSMALFKFLGVIEQYRIDVDHKLAQKKAVDKKEKKLLSAEQATFEAMLVAKFSRGDKSPKSNKSYKVGGDREKRDEAALSHAKQQYQLNLLRLKSENPTWSDDEVRAAANQEERNKWQSILKRP